MRWASAASNGSAYAAPAAVERAVERRGAEVRPELHEDAEHVPEREPLVGPVAAAVPEVDDVGVARERLAWPSLPGLEPQHLGERERLDPPVAGVARDVGRALEVRCRLDRVRRLERERRARTSPARARSATRRGRGGAAPRRRAARLSRCRRRSCTRPNACRARARGAPAIPRAPTRPCGPSTRIASCASPR